MNPRILIVDDEPNVLSAYQRVMHRIYEVRTATSAAQALEILSKDRDFAVIVSDMRMPGVSGLTLLKHAQRFAPDIVRIMLTGADDQKTAVDAVNSGQVFRFLRKPCPSHVFLATMEEAVKSHQTARHEREIMEKTFSGVVDMLTDMMATADPQSGRRAQQLREKAGEIARILDVRTTWEIESAAMLLNIGIVTLPAHILHKMREREPLLDAETALYARVPELGARLLENIPRLEPIAAIVRHQNRTFDGHGTPADGPTGCEIPIGARIVHPLVEIQKLRSGGLSFGDALAALRVDVQKYDPDVLEALEALDPRDDDDSEAHEYRMAAELRPGMRLGADALSQDGLPLVMAGARLTGVLIARLLNFSELGLLREPLFVTVPEARNATAVPAPAESAV
jgi:response regulator RpfG family c-di-GMP phosphodiesterase